MAFVGKSDQWWELAGLTEVEAELVRRALRAQRQKWMGAHSHGRGTTAERLNRIRYAKKKAHAVRKLLGRRSVFPLNKRQLLLRFTESTLLSGFVPNRKATWKNVSHRVPFEELSLEGFSFLENPKATIAALTRIAEIECRAASARLNFKDDYCEDAGAFLVLEAMWRRMARVFSGGDISSAVGRVLEAVTLTKSLNGACSSAYLVAVSSRRSRSNFFASTRA